MKFLGLERDNLTDLSDPDSFHNSYSASFEYYPCHEGTTCSIFKGILNGDGPLAGKFCAVRTWLERPGERNDWNPLLKRAHRTQELARKFNKELGYNAVSCVVPLLTQIEAVSKFAGLFRCAFPHQKRLKKDEWVTIEPLLKPFQSTFTNQKSPNSNMKNIQLEKSHCVTDSATSNTIQAFSHFTWHATKELVVCDLQGLCNSRSHTLTSPTIHSLNNEFGATDRSTEGIVAFFASHRCNDICSRWSSYKPKTEFDKTDSDCPHLSESAFGCFPSCYRPNPASFFLPYTANTCPSPHGLTFLSQEKDGFQENLPTNVIL